MTEVERLILDKLDGLAQEIGETKGEATQAREAAEQAREEAAQARETSEQAREAAEQARGEAAQARETAEQAREAAEQAREEAAQASEAATQAHETAVKAGQEAREAKKIVLRTQMLLENEISSKIDVIGEGHDFLKMRLEEALQMESKRERMELEILNLSMKVKAIERRLDAM